MIRAGDAPAETSGRPRRVLLGSDAHALVTEALRRRLDEAEGQKERAALADGPCDHGIAVP
jgi:hypothetical protein